MRISFFLFLLVSSSVVAQVTYSPYSYFGVGITRNRTSPLNKSLSDTGIGIRDPLHFNSYNPAAINAMENISFMANVGLFIESGKYANSSASTKYKNGRLSAVDFWFKLSKYWSTQVGIAPYSFVNYGITSSVNYTGNSETVTLAGNGSINRLFWTNAFRITKNLSVGGSVALLRGSIEKTETLNSGIYIGTQYSDTLFVSGTAIDFGAQYTVKLPKKWEATFGAIWQVSNKISQTKHSNLNFIYSGASVWSSKSVMPTIYTPQKIGFGFSLAKGKWMLASDYAYTFWANTDRTVNMRNSSRASVGGTYQVQNNPNSLRAPWSLRTGFFIEQNPLNLSRGPFNTWGFSLGAGLPIASNRGIVHLTYQFYKTGTTNSGLIKQQAGIFCIDFTFRDLWGIKRKFD